MTRRRIRLLRLLAPALLLACGDELGPRVPAAIVVTPEAPRLVTGGTLQLTATVVDASGQEIPGQPVTFRSSDIRYITVDDAGLLTSAGFAGSSLITATSGDITAEVEARVVLPPSTLVGIPASLELNTDEWYWISVTVTDENGEPVPDAPLAFQSSDPSIVEVKAHPDVEGSVLVTGLVVGTATVTLTSGELSAEVPVTVGRFPTQASIAPSSLVLSPGGSQQLTVALRDRVYEEIEGSYPTTWSSSDEGVVAVSTNGMATAIAEGSARITATIDTFSASIGVFVGTPPPGEMLARLPLAGAHGVAVAPDGRYFVAGSGTLASGALPDFAFSAELSIDGTLVGVALDAGGTRAYVVRESGGTGPGVVVVDLATNSAVDFIPVTFGSPQSAAVSSDGSVLTVATSHGLEVVDLATKRSIGRAIGGVLNIIHHPTRPLLYATGGTGVLELDDSSLERTRTFAGDAWAHTVSADGTRLYIVGLDGGTSIWNLETGVQERGNQVQGDGVAVTPDGRFLYVLYSYPAESRVFIVDRASGALLREVVLGGLAQRIAMSGEGIALISSGGDAGSTGWVDFLR